MTQYESHLSASDDLTDHDNSLRLLMEEADRFIALRNAGTTLTPQQLTRLGTLTAQLRQRFEAQMDQNDRIVHLDLHDDSYDNSAIDHRIRQQISAIRNMDQDLNSGFLLRLPRKVSGWFEDVGKWFRVTTRDVLDGGNQALKVAGVVGGGVGGAWLGTMLGGPLGGVVGGGAGLLAYPALRWMFGSNRLPPGATPASR